MRDLDEVEENKRSRQRKLACSKTSERACHLRESSSLIPCSMKVQKVIGVEQTRTKRPSVYLKVKLTVPSG